MKRKRQIFFDIFRLDTNSQELFCKEQALDLRAKSVAVLQYLAERSPETVTKRELLDAIWPDVTVGEGVLKVCINDIRNALGDDQAAPQFIETRSKRGYRFIAATSKIPMRPDSIRRRGRIASGFTEHMLSENIKTMRFREEWQPIVNNLVSETSDCLRAMVFDVELKKWWNSIAGQLYMTTNTKLLKKGASIRRIFILSSKEPTVMRNALLTAYVHHKLGIQVKICESAQLKEAGPFKADMFSLHDSTFMALYDLFGGPATASIICEGKHVSEFRSFYDEIFNDDRRCRNIGPELQRFNRDRTFLREAEKQIAFLNSIQDLSSTELLKRL
ncbi:MAG TPA: winged helix-turn-helix domain-containing protein [Blastocatellia bacterium]|nr:winged helix-turn-helix domain-containing protein [Blastocatellia bacterium]